MNNHSICQSCSMPLESREDYGTNVDSSISDKYCVHCYKNGKFTSDISMEEMIERVIPYFTNAIDGVSGDMAKTQLKKYFQL